MGQAPVELGLGRDIDRLVTPWRVRSPRRVTSTWAPVVASAGRATGVVSLNVEVGKLSVWMPSRRRRLSRIERSLVIVVMSTLKSAVVTLSALPLAAMVTHPLTDDEQGKDDGDQGGSGFHGGIVPTMPEWFLRVTGRQPRGRPQCQNPDP